MNITGSVLAQRNRALVGGDYSSYHAQTARRVHAIRKRLGVTTRRGQKFISKERVTVTDIAKNSE
jgi:signal recognition particle subunit SRP68